MWHSHYGFTLRQTEYLSRGFMRFENCLEEMSVISHVLSTVTSNASQFSSDDAQKHHPTVFRRKNYRRVRGALKAAAKYSRFRADENQNLSSDPGVAAQVDEVERSLADLAARQVRLTHAISGMSAESIRESFGEDRYQNLRNLDLSIRGLEGYVNQIIRSAGNPHPYILRLSRAITECRLAVADLLMILDQCFQTVEFSASRTGLIDEDVFADFIYH
ncbi:hypothetical protein [Pantoea sp. Morm]|uniref:hypothetical protein n=1 Tax=Pantoea sp. Morm TaxID=2601250 RepID=UPI0031FD4EE7